MFTKSYLFLRFPSVKKIRINFSASWWSVNEKYFWLLFTGSVGF